MDIIKVVYYYLRDSDRNNCPVITVCLLQDELDNIGKGLALCSVKETPIKKVGRIIAYNRALIALKRKKSSLPICTNRYPTTFTSCKYKSLYNYLIVHIDRKLLYSEK